MDHSRSSRDRHGRSAAGNPGGPGRARSRANALRRAAKDAISEKDVVAIMRKATHMALEGNPAAMRLVLKRAGRLRRVTFDDRAVDRNPQDGTTATTCALAIARIVDAMCAGTCECDSARSMIDVIKARLSAIELTDIESRLAELERRDDEGDQRKRG